MARDNVLRIFINEIVNGQNRPGIFDALDVGNAYRIVLEWTSWSGRENEGQVPRRSIDIAKECFRLAGDKASCELICNYSVDFSLFNFQTVERDMPEIWADPNNLSMPRPDDDA